MQRNLAFNILYKTVKDSSYSNLLMRNELEKIPSIQRPFVTNLVSGVLKNYWLLEYQHSRFYKKTNLKCRIILSMAAYEKFFMHEKDYVINNEYPKLAPNDYDKDFVNAVLHKYDKLIEPNESYIKYSIPEWIYNLLSKQYTKDELQIILNNYQRIPKVYYRINHNKCKFNDLNKYDIEQIDDNVFTSSNNLLNTEEFNNGFFYVQDINAASLIDLFEFSKGDLFLDACSAPGSKLFNAIEHIEQKNAYANDINETRVNLIKTKASILGFDGINYSCIDATKLHEHFDIDFDKILLDVPCSGLGVIGRRSDIKFHIKPESLDSLQQIQADILDSASKILKKNGHIIYSTCTLNKKENTKQIMKFLKSHQDFILVTEKTILNLDGDLFYEALLKKV